jgi:hypothetical protein
MRIFIATLILAAGFLAPSVSGQEDCPKIILVGPAGIVPLGELMTYSVNVGGARGERELEFEWSSSAGTIHSGQGTSSIQIVRPKGTLTVTVKISGLPPQNCPDTFSESSSWDGLPVPAKVGVWKAGQPFAPLQQFSADMAANVDNQGYVFITRAPNSTEDSLSELRKTALSYGPQDSSRVTIVESQGPEELIEIWRVPPGANNPICESCNSTECPTLRVVVPDRMTTSGESAEFSLRIDPVPNRRTTVDWQVSSGTIEKGQGTEKISVRTLKETAGQSIVATASVQGLPPGCVSTVSDAAAVSPIVDPFILLDDWGPIPQNDEKGRLVTIAAEALKRPGSIIQFIIFLSPKEPASSAGTRIERIREFLTTRYKIPPSRLIFVNGGRRETRTRVYLTPAGSEPFQP